MISRISTNNWQKNETLRPAWQHCWSMFQANHPPLHLQSQIDLLALPLCSPLQALDVAQSRFRTNFPRQMILPYQLNKPLLFLQPHLFCCIQLSVGGYHLSFHLWKNKSNKDEISLKLLSNFSWTLSVLELIHQYLFHMCCESCESAAGILTPRNTLWETFLGQIFRKSSNFRRLFLR